MRGLDHHMADTEPVEWTVSEVAEWVLETFADSSFATGIAAKVVEEEIDGDALLSYGQTKLLADLEIKCGTFAKIWKRLHVDTLCDVPISTAGTVGSPRPGGRAGALLTMQGDPVERQLLLQSVLDRWHPARWSLQKELGNGAAGVVWQVTDSRLDSVAIKFTRYDGQRSR